MGFHFLFQGIFPTQGLNPYLLHWHVDSSPSEPQQDGHVHISGWWDTMLLDGGGYWANPWSVAWFGGSAERDLA